MVGEIRALAEMVPMAPEVDHRVIPSFVCDDVCECFLAVRVMWMYVAGSNDRDGHHHLMTMPRPPALPRTIRLAGCVATY